MDATSESKSKNSTEKLTAGSLSQQYAFTKQLGTLEMQSPKVTGETHNSPKLEQTSINLNGMGSNPKADQSQNLLFKILAALFYASSSCAITIINKEVLTNYSFPAPFIVILGQIISIVVCLFVAKNVLGVITFPGFSRGLIGKIFPLPILYMGNLFGGILSTKALSLTMFVCLRRLSIWMTMIGESYFLGTRHNFVIKLSVYVMILGSFIAAFNDLAFNLYGYICINLNNFATAANGVCTKKKLESKDLGKYGILFYNALFTFPLAYFICQKNGSFEKIHDFEHWHDTNFLILFFLSCFMGLILNLSLVLCTHYNSALITTVVGTLKNIIVTYYGIIFPTADYIFTWSNFLGVTVSMLGSLLFSYYSFRMKK